MTSAVQGSVREALEADPDVLCVSAGSRTLCPIDHSHAGCRTITEDDIEAHMMTTTGGSPPLDILVRTSGVQRFSDFLLWQVRTVTCGHRSRSPLMSLFRVVMIPKSSSPRATGPILACAILFPSSWTSRGKCGSPRDDLLCCRRFRVPAFAALLAYLFIVSYHTRYSHPSTIPKRCSSVYQLS